MRSFLYAVGVISLLMHGVAKGGVMHSVVSDAVAKRGVNAVVAKAKRVGMTLLVGVAFACSVTGCERGDAGELLSATSTNDAKESVRIGLNTTVVRSPAGVKSAQLAVDELNAEGGVRGMPIVLVVSDTMDSADAAVAGAEELIVKHRVHALVGPNYSRLAIPISEVAQRYGIPMVSGAATNPNVTKAGDYVFMSAFTDNFQGKVMASFATNELQAQNASIVYEEGEAYSEGLAKAFEVNFTEQGGTIVSLDSYPLEGVPDNDLSAQVQVLVDNNPDVLFIPGFLPETPQLMKQSRAAGITAIFLGGDSWSLASYLDHAGAEVLEGAYFSEHFSAHSPELLTAEARSFLAAYEATHGEGASPSPLIYDAVRIVVQAMRRADDLSPEAIRDEIAATRNYHGATSITEYDENRHVSKPAVIYRIENGELVLHGLFAADHDF